MTSLRPIAAEIASASITSDVTSDKCAIISVGGGDGELLLTTTRDDKDCSALR